MTAGAALVMWFGELITERGIGNGMSLLIFAGIASRIPSEGKAILDSRGPLVFALVCVAALAIVTAVVFVEQGQRRIPVQYAKRMVGRKMYGGSSTYLPLKVNQAGVIPVIFASSLLYLPNLIAQLTSVDHRCEPELVAAHHPDLSRQPEQPGLHRDLLLADRVLHVLLRGDHVQPGGARRRDEEVRWLHPGYPTRAADRRLSQLRFEPDHTTWLDLPRCGRGPAERVPRHGRLRRSRNLPFGGTAVLIMVSVGLDTVKQIESQLMQRNYEGFLK